ncbi:MAG: hypothetical protein RLZZ288_1062, partial [Planctomycetota bacterium]
IFLAPLTVPLAPTGNPMDAGSAPSRKATPAAVKSRNDDDEPTK